MIIKTVIYQVLFRNLSVLSVVYTVNLTNFHSPAIKFWDVSQELCWPKYFS